MPNPSFPGVSGLVPLPADADGRAAAGGEAGAMLDKSKQNVPSRASRVAWTVKHWRIKGALRDFLLWSESVGGHRFFLTLTSSRVSGSRERLRRDFQALRKRLARKLQIDPSEVAYCGVDTTEGCGVLHLLVSVPRGKGRNARFLVSVEWLRAAWVEIHSAQQLRVVPVRSDKSTARRLSSYMVSQYVAGQDALVRLSRSRIGLISAATRRAFYRLVFDNSARWEGWSFFGGTPIEALRAGVVTWGPQYWMCRGHWWRTFRDGWESFVRTGRAFVFGRCYVAALCGGFELE